ncbi:MAG: protein kinase domain-containing protein, partial [Prosthecobacter sp.]
MTATAELPYASCPQCGTPLRPDMPCAGCALELALLGVQDFEARHDDVTLILPEPQPGFEALAEWTLPHQLAGYELRRVVGRGGMGVVFDAHDPRLERRVAIKVLHGRAAASAMAQQLFQQEMRAIARLDHPHIVTVHHADEESGVPFFVMEFVRGQDLGRRVREHGPLATLEALQMLIPAAEALAAAHAIGIVHRDVKPTNILGTAEGVVKVADFGVSHLLSNVPDGENEVQCDGHRPLLGTVDFMAPEQAANPDAVDARADVYGLGCTLFYLLTGQEPCFEIPGRAAKLAAHRDGKLPDLAALRPGLPAEVDALWTKMTACDPAERYQTMQEALAELRQCEDRVSGNHARRQARRRRVLLVAGGVSLAALVVGSTVALWQAREAGRHARRAEAERDVARRALARSALSLAEAGLREGDGQQIRTALDLVPQDLRDPTWRYLLTESDTSLAQVRTGTADLRGAAAHPTLPGVFAVSDGQGKVTLLQARTGERRLAFTPALERTRPGQDLWLAFSADGGRIAVGGGGSPGGIVIHSAVDGRKIIGWQAARSSHLAFSPDGQTLLQEVPDGKSLTLWSAADGRELWTYRPEQPWETPKSFARGIFTPDGRQIIAHSNAAPLRLLDPKDGSVVRDLDDVPLRSYSSMILSPDGKLLITEAFPRNVIRGLQVETGKVVFQFPPPHDGGGRLAFTPDGRHFARAVALAEGRQALDVFDAETGALEKRLLGGEGRICALAMHPLSGELLIAGPDTRLWPMSLPPPEWTFGKGLAAQSVAFWDAENMVIAPSGLVATALHQLSSTGSSTLLWKPEIPPQHHHYLPPSLSADGTLAAIGFSAPRTPVQLLRRSGTRVEQVGCFMPSGDVEILRLSPDGRRLAVLESGRKVELLELGGQSAVRPPAALDCTGVVMVSDMDWLDSNRLAAVVTTRAPRGVSGSEEQVVVWEAAR